MEQEFMSLWGRGMKKYISFIATVLLIITNLSIFCLPGWSLYITLFNTHATSNTHAWVIGLNLQKSRLREIPDILGSGKQIQDLKQVFIYWCVLLKLSTKKITVQLDKKTDFKMKIIEDEKFQQMQLAKDMSKDIHEVETK